MLPQQPLLPGALLRREFDVEHGPFQWTMSHGPHTSVNFAMCVSIMSLFVLGMPSFCTCASYGTAIGRRRRILPLLPAATAAAANTRACYAYHQWDDCDCGDCELCGGTLPVSFTDDEIREADEAWRARQAAEHLAAQKADHDAAVARQAAVAAERKRLRNEELQQLVDAARAKEATARAEADRAARLWVEKHSAEEERVRRVLDAAEKQRDELKSLVDRLESRVEELREAKEHAARDLKATEDTLAAIGRQADFYVQYVGEHLDDIPAASGPRVLRDDDSLGGFVGGGADSGGAAGGAAGGAGGPAPGPAMPSPEEASRLLGIEVPAQARLVRAAEELTTRNFGVINGVGGLDGSFIRELRQEIVDLFHASVSEGELAAFKATLLARHEKRLPAEGAEAKPGDRIPRADAAGRDAHGAAAAGGSAATSAVATGVTLSEIKVEDGSFRGDDRVGGATMGSGDSQEDGRAPGPQFRRGELAGGRTGANLKYSMSHVRGDYVCWLSGEEPGCAHLRKLLSLIDHMVGERLPQLVPELGRAMLFRSLAMCTVYPGSGAHYVRHIDNPNKNGRLLTAILYLNEEWTTTDGGQLRIFKQDSRPGDGGPYTDIEPFGGRMVLFWSDARVPHEVLPSSSMRLAITTWYFDLEERAVAISTAAGDDVSERESARIRREMDKFEKQGITPPRGSGMR